MGIKYALVGAALVVATIVSVYFVFMGVYHWQRPTHTDFWQRVVAGLIAAIVAGIVLLLWIIAAIIILGGLD